MKRPTIIEVREYWRAEGLKGDPSSFFDHFESNGWKVSGKAPMKDWKAAARNWSRREKQFCKATPNWVGNERSYTREELKSRIRDPLAEF